MAHKPPKPSSATDFVVIAFAGITSILLIGAIFFLIFAPVVAANWILAAAIVGSVLLIFGVLRLVKYVMDLCHEYYGTGRIERTRNEMMVGLSGVWICSTIPRIAAYFMGTNYHLFIYTLTVSLLTCFMFHFLFNYRFNQWCKLNYDNGMVSELVLIPFHIVLLGFLVSINVDLGVTKKQETALFLGQLVMTVLPFISSWELSVVFKKGLIWQGHKRVINNSVDQLTSLLIPSFSILLALLSMVFIGFSTSTVSNYSPTVDWTTVGITVGACLLVVIVLGLFKVLIVFINEKLKKRTYDLVLTETMIGFSGIAIFAFLPRIVVFVVGCDVPIYLSSVIISIFTVLTFYRLFISPNQHLWRLDFSKNCNLILIIVGIHIIILVAAIRFAITYENPKDIEVIIWTQSVFSFLCLACVIDLAVVLKGGLVMINEGNGDVEMGPMKVKKEKKEKPTGNHSRPECKICILLFNPSTVIPRMLKECGHTVCGGCADKLIGKQQLNQIVCPFCQVATVVGEEEIDEGVFHRSESDGRVELGEIDELEDTTQRSAKKNGKKKTSGEAIRTRYCQDSIANVVDLTAERDEMNISTDISSDSDVSVELNRIDEIEGTQLMT
ncbi:hypothetical protein CRE_05275 [Caenorhabditis remanei]|uniref:RING-type domain-containing protein n=1 Tax=Caenorhabditis remanei TaxID=31234 RepID=E3NK46_CAERE|nr:hypothetical protein CRE_05275 [Caenorhabditis remanei]